MESVLTYKAMHQKLKRKRGRAAEQTCSACNNQASTWAYMHNCEDELIDDGWAYCPHIEHYSAMCMPCHMKLDESYGETHWQAKLTEAAVIDMRQKYATGNFVMAELGAIYGVSEDTANKAIVGSTWTHLPILTSYRRTSRTTLTYEQAEEVRAAYAAGEATQAELGQRYGLAQTAISAIVRRKTYKHPGTGIRGTLKAHRKNERTS